MGTVHVYFEAATVILTLVLLGQVLEARAHSRTSGAIKALLNLAPNTAFRLVGGIEEIVGTDKINPGDLFRIKPGNETLLAQIVKMVNDASRSRGGRTTFSLLFFSSGFCFFWPYCFYYLWVFL